MTRRFLANMYQRLEFKLDWSADRLIAPRLTRSQYAYYETLREYVQSGAQWLDLGCGHQVFASWMDREQADVIKRSKTVVGIDRDWVGLRAHAGIAKKV